MLRCSPGKPGRGSSSQHDKAAVGKPKAARHVGSHAEEGAGQLATEAAKGIARQSASSDGR